MTEIKTVADNLEDHSVKLKQIQKNVNKGMRLFEAESFNQKKKMNEQKFIKIYDEQNHLLNVVGELSLSRRRIEDKLKNQYVETYSSSPAIGKKLFLNHYYNLHKPYDTLKEIIWRNLMVLDHYNIKILKK